MQAVRQWAARSALGPYAVLPTRVAYVGRHNFRTLAASVKWLIASREYTNFTYDLTPLNLTHLAWFVAGTTGEKVATVRAYIDEALTDEHLVSHVRRCTQMSPRRRLADPQVRLAKRLGWSPLCGQLRQPRALTPLAL